MLFFLEKELLKAAETRIIVLLQEKKLGAKYKELNSISAMLSLVKFLAQILKISWEWSDFVKTGLLPEKNSFAVYSFGTRACFESLHQYFLLHIPGRSGATKNEYLQPGRMGVVIKFSNEQCLSYTSHKYLGWQEYTVLFANISFNVSSSSKLQNIQSTCTESSFWSGIHYWILIISSILLCLDK